MSYEQLISIKRFLDNPSGCLDSLTTTRSPLILIQNDTPVAVLQDVQQYQKLTDAVCMLKLIAQGEQEIQDGKGRTQADVFADIDAMFESRNA